MNIDELLNVLPIFEYETTFETKRLFFKDRNISKLELYVEYDYEDMEIVIVPLDYQRGTLNEYTYRFIFYPDTMVGYMIVRNDLPIPDSACISLYKHNIEVQSLIHHNGKNMYDRDAIERKALLDSLINE